MKQAVNIFWFRRDLRLDDNAGLYHALQSGKPVLPIFIFDTNILDRLENKEDKRVMFIHQVLTSMQEWLLESGSSLLILKGSPEEAFEEICKDYNVDEVFTNNDYEPYARDRDASIKKLLAEKKIGFHTYKDQVIFDKDDVLKDDGTPYTVFTPYSRKWKAALEETGLQSFDTKKYFSNFLQTTSLTFLSLADIGFKEIEAHFPDKKMEQDELKDYAETRDYPGIDGTSRLGIHFRFGTISIRKAVSFAQKTSATFLNELIWREFYHMILWHFRKVGEGKAFKAAYDNIEWRRDDGEFEKWCQGKTGYPIVDAGMRQLNETGYMHNRVRMIVASFLAKHLLLDWRLGEAYFAEKLLDYDLAANNGGWQWAAGSGCDAAPYFRIFNPYLQTKKFDPDFTYIKKWVPEFQEFNYPEPIVDHKMARERCLAAYSKALKKD